MSYHTLVTWLVRRRREKPPEKRPAVHFAEVAPPALTSGLEVCLHGGVVVRGQDAAQLAALVKALR